MQRWSGHWNCPGWHVPPKSAAHTHISLFTTFLATLSLCLVVIKKKLVLPQLPGPYFTATRCDRTWQNSRQSASSEPSPQSLSVSQRQVWGIQCWLEQVNWLAGHVPGSRVGQLYSSLLSKQSFCPSQRHPAGTQCLLAQVNAAGEQVVSGGKKEMIQLKKCQFEGLEFEGS